MWTDELSNDELQVLDLALSYFKDKVRYRPQAIGMNTKNQALYKLHSQVLATKLKE